VSIVANLPITGVEGHYPISDKKGLSEMAPVGASFPKS
jgi:hypothetical protein